MSNLVVLCTGEAMFWPFLANSGKLEFPRICGILQVSVEHTAGQQESRGATAPKQADRAGATAPAGIVYTDRLFREP